MRGDPSFRPDLLVRETAEFGAALAAELHDLPHTRITTGLNATEELILQLRCESRRRATARNRAFLPDPEARRLRRDALVLTFFPASLDDPDFPIAARHSAVPRPGLGPVRDGCRRGRRPLVYITFGTEAGKDTCLRLRLSGGDASVEDLDADVLITVGRDADPGMLGEPPPHVRIERWVDQATILGHAAAIICHGGGGSVLGALAAGVPLVVVPLFAEDQHINARRIAAVGAGLVVAPEAEPMRSALWSVLFEHPFRAAASSVAAELQQHAGLDELSLREPERSPRRRSLGAVQEVLPVGLAVYVIDLSGLSRVSSPGHEGGLR